MWFIAKRPDTLLDKEEAKLNSAEFVQIVNLWDCMSPWDHFLLYLALFSYCFFVVVAAVTFSFGKFFKSGIKIS